MWLLWVSRGKGRGLVISKHSCVIFSPQDLCSCFPGWPVEPPLYCCLLPRVPLPFQLLPQWSLDNLIFISLQSPSFPLVIQIVQMFRFALHLLAPSWVPRSWDQMRDSLCWGQGLWTFRWSCVPQNTTPIILDPLWESVMFPSLLRNSCEVHCPTSASRGTGQWRVPDFWCHWSSLPTLLGGLPIGNLRELVFGL